MIIIISFYEVFMAVSRLFPVLVSRGYSLVAVWELGFSLRWLLLPNKGYRVWTSAVVAHGSLLAS